MKWEEEYEAMSGDDKLPMLYYKCEHSPSEGCAIKFEQASKGFWKIYSCEATCGGVNVPFK